MKYDHKLVRESNKKRAEAELKEAIKKALKTDLYYEDICEIVAKAINEVTEEKEIMELILNVGDKITAEVEKRDRAGRLKKERLRFLIIKNFSNKVVAITDEFKNDDSDAIFRSFDLNELFNINTEANKVKIKVED